MAHGLRDWMLMHIFYIGLSETSRVFLDKECEGSFMNMFASIIYLMACFWKQKLKKVWIKLKYLKKFLMTVQKLGFQV